jgi:hypothetical protein
VSVGAVSGCFLHSVVLCCSPAFGGSFCFRVEYCNKQFKPTNHYACEATHTCHHDAHKP